MKFLFIFCDMLSSTRIKTFNKDVENNSKLDRIFKKIKGTAFTNCYTPAPDTPRSLASMYTGKYPKENGCDLRYKWPKYYLKNNVETIFDFVKNNKYSVYSNISSARSSVGFLPKNAEKFIVNYNSLNQLIRNKKHILAKKKLLLFIDLIDYHQSIEDFGGLYIGNKFGIEKISNAITKLFSAIPHSTFDYIIFFSDHGCQLSDDKSLNDLLLLPFDNRSKILMFIHKSGNKKINLDNRLCSIMDLFPTIKNIIHASHKNISSLLSKKKLEKPIVIEDHAIFSPEDNFRHKVWGVRSKEWFYVVSENSDKLFKVLSSYKYKLIKKKMGIIFELKKYLNIFSTSYSDHVKYKSILNFYNQMKITKIKYYNDDTKTKNFLFKKIAKIMFYIIKLTKL